MSTRRINASTQVTNLNTANVSESLGNLYYSNSRVYANVLTLLSTLAGNNISIAANGQISANVGAGGGGGSYTLPTASTTTLGGVKIDGTSITIDGSGVISSTGGGGGGTSSTPNYITMYQPGSVVINNGTTRYYPPRSLTISNVSASCSIAPINQNFVFAVLKNGNVVHTSNIIAANYVRTAVAANISLLTTDYLTVNVLSGSLTDLQINLQYS